MSADDLIVHAPRRREAEFAWICERLLTDRLGLGFRIDPHDRDTVVIEAGTGRVEWPDRFFAAADADWLSPASLPDPARLISTPVPDAELARRVDSASMPLLFAADADAGWQVTEGRIRLPVDLTGTAFFLLSRYEEAVAGAPADRHGRFPGSAAFVHRAGLALRPVVDELVELLWWALQRIAPGLQRKPQRPSTWVSCDVDAPFSPAGLGWRRAARQVASHLVNDRSSRRAGLALRHAAAASFGNHRHDPFDTFDWMLERNARHGNRMTFYWLSLRAPEAIDCCYRLAEPRIAALLAKLVARGHEIGLHGSYASVDDRGQALACQLADLKAAVARAGGSQTRFGARQHYLRWRMPGTARLLAGLGLDHDSTLGFADVAGFRCGTCHPYPLWDPVAGEALALVERPLSLMEVTVTSPGYLNLGLGPAALDLMLAIKRRCAHFGGEFALLWHNSNLSDPRSREVYDALIGPPA
jgi:hypothetical protein